MGPLPEAFVKRCEQCNELLHAAGQGYLTESEERALGFPAHQAVSYAPGKALTVQASWYQRMAQDCVRRSYFCIQIL